MCITVKRFLHPSYHVISAMDLAPLDGNTFSDASTCPLLRWSHEQGRLKSRLLTTLFPSSQLRSRGRAHRVVTIQSFPTCQNSTKRILYCKLVPLRHVGNVVDQNGTNTFKILQVSICTHVEIFDVARDYWLISTQWDTTANQPLARKFHANAVRAYMQIVKYGMGFQTSRENPWYSFVQVRLSTKEPPWTLFKLIW